MVVSGQCVARKSTYDLSLLTSQTAIALCIQDDVFPQTFEKDVLPVGHCINRSTLKMHS